MHKIVRPVCAMFVAGATIAAVAPATPAGAHTAAAPSDFQQVELAKGLDEMGEPMSLAVLPDRSVLHTSRDGTVRRTDAAGNTRVIGTIPVYFHDEEGMQGVAADPGFATNRFIYLYYAPPLSTPGGDAPATGTDATWATWRGVERLSRFTLNGDFSINTGSARTVLDVPADRGICCHVGGDIDFDAAGNLYLSTGDDTNPFDSAGYAPIDERTNRNPAFDAQRSAANTNDLRGKVLRIKVNGDGSYAIPSGNLFPPGTAGTRPEIYAMGLRNPFRMSVDKATGVLYLGDYGPDAGGTNPDRGPSGQVEFDRVPSAGNYGWPYCTGTNTTTETYNEWNFATNTTGPKFNCAGGATNNSFRNTGRAVLPAAKPAWIRYAGDGGSPPEFGSGSESPMGGPVYRFDAANPSPVKFPAEFDGDYFAGEFGRRWIKTVEVNADGSRGAIADFPWSGTQVMDMSFGPDGALYVLDYGSGFGNGDENSALYRIEFIGGGNRAPSAVAGANRTSGPAPLAVQFSSAGSSDPEDGALTYSWAFGDGTSSTAANPSKTYTTNGTFTATLTVRDPQGATGSASVRITVGNTAPVVTVSTPLDGQLFAFGDAVPYQVSVTDPEDGTIDCGRVKMTYLLGHDSHAHQITSRTGCSGTIQVPVDGEHDAAANIFGVFDGEYTDNGGLTVHTQHVLQPRHRQAEHFATSAGVGLFEKATAEGGRTVGDIQNGDWIAFSPYTLAGAASFTARVSSGGAGGTLSLRAGSPTGPVLGSAPVPVTGSWETFTNVSGTLSGAPAGSTALYLVFTGASGALFDVDSFTLNGTSAPSAFDVLVFSKTAGFRHDSIPAGIQAIRDLGAANGFTVTATEDAAAFTTANLARYEAVVFLNTTGDVLGDAQQSAFESYIRSGHGFVGVHSAADTEYDWPFYGEVVGAYFDSHPPIQAATVRVEDRSHPATSHLGPTWNRTDEWYNYRTSVRGTARVLATLDESTYSGGTMGADHPHIWCKTVGSGRSFYTGGGHTQQSYADPAFRTHLLGGIRYAAGAVTADCRPGSSPGGRVEAESFSSQSGTQVVQDTGAHGGARVGFIDNGDWLGFAAVPVNGRTGFAARVASGGPGGTIQVRTGSASGPILGSVAVPNTGDYGAFVDVSTALSAGTGPLFLVFTGTGGGLFDVDDFALTGTGQPAANLALGRPATADSACAANEGPEKAVNGSVSGGNADKWCSLGAAKWWRVDLQSTTRIARVVVRHAAAGGESAGFNTRDFDVQTSTDATNWTTVAQVRGNTAAVTTHTFAATDARYVRLVVVTPTSTGNGAARIYEFEVYAT